MARILLMGAPYQVPDHHNRTLADCFEATGRNTGNLLIGNGIVSQLECDRLEPYRYSMDPAYIEENFDQVVIAAANFLYPGFDLSPLSAALDSIRLPAFMVGLGAQLPSAADDLHAIPEGTWRLVQIVSERSKSIGVRGYFTADQLRKNGISNVRVTGCPSLYTSLRPSTRLRRVQDVSGRTVFNGSRNVVGHSVDKESAVRVERELLRHALHARAPFVLQNEQPEMQLATGASFEEHEETLRALGVFFRTPPEELAAYYRECGKVFFSIAEWFDWIRDYDFSIGTRFHGNVAALLNGVPAVVLVHDSRTRELCEFTGIPHVFVQDVDTLDVQRIYDEANFDLFEERYNLLFRKYIEFLDENRIAHKLRYEVDIPPRGRITFASAPQGA